MRCHGARCSRRRHSNRPRSNRRRSNHDAGFRPLRLHTEYSLIDSVVRVAELMDAVRARACRRVALTDQCNLFAMVKFYRAALERACSRSLASMCC